MNAGAQEINSGDRAGTDLLLRISVAAQRLNEQRERWLNPPEWIEPIARAVDAEDDFADVPEDVRALKERRGSLRGSVGTLAPPQGGGRPHLGSRSCHGG